MKIKIKYNGSYPCLCMGHLQVWLDDNYYDFGSYCLQSGGLWYFDKDGDVITEQGEWTLESVPDNFPPEYITPLLKVINEQIPLGCCGGCS